MISPVKYAIITILIWLMIFLMPSGFEGWACDGGSNQLSSDSAANLTNMEMGPSTGEAYSNQSLEPPPLCHLDMEVIESLPPEILSELNEAYGGKLVTLIPESKSKSEEIGNDKIGNTFCSVYIDEQTVNIIISLCT